MAVTIINAYRVAASAPAWTPADITTKWWMDAADAATITSSAGAVSQWTDKSANAYTFSQSTAGAKPTTGATTQNGRNVITGDSGDSLTCDQTAASFQCFTDGTACMIGIVWNPGAGGDETLPFGNMAGSGGKIGIYLDATDVSHNLLVRVQNGASNVVLTLAGAFSDNTANLHTFLETYSSPNLTISGFRNGGTATDQTSAYTTTATAPTDTMALFATRQAAANILNLNGGIMELVVATGAAATETNRALLRDYLNTKWAVY